MVNLKNSIFRDKSGPHWGDSHPDLRREHRVDNEVTYNELGTHFKTASKGKPRIHPHYNRSDKESLSREITEEKDCSVVMPLSQSDQ